MLIWGGEQRLLAARVILTKEMYTNLQYGATSKPVLWTPEMTSCGPTCCHSSASIFPAQALACKVSWARNSTSKTQPPSLLLSKPLHPLLLLLKPWCRWLIAMSFRKYGCYQTCSMEQNLPDPVLPPFAVNSHCNYRILDSDLFIFIFYVSFNVLSGRTLCRQ